MDSSYPEEKVPTYRPINQPPTYSNQASQKIVILPTDIDLTIHQHRSRKLRAAIVLISAAFWVAYIISISVTEHRSSGVSSSCNGLKSLENLTASILEWPVPSDVNIDDCTNMIQDPTTASNYLRRHFSSSAVFELPLSSEKLFLLSRGASAGSVKIVQSDRVGISGRNNAKVHVVARYRHASVLSQVRLCAISRHGDQRGIGIFSPQSLAGWKFGIHYDITVHLPPAVASSPLQIKHFETDLPLFVHNIGMLADTAHFDQLSLKGSMVQINVGSLSAKNAHIETTNAKIEGTFYTSSALELTTTNAPIKVYVGLTNHPNTQATRLAMRTTNAAVTARMSLSSTARMGGQFKVTGFTTIGPLYLAFVDAPVGSGLLLNAQTSFAPATVDLHSTYEGEFRLATSSKQAIVSVDNSVMDPAGRGRRRAVELQQGGQSHAAGSVSWSPQGRRMGSVYVETSSAAIMLRV
ncbi:hypothetical protein BDZ94DRAFT_1217155 [Collybia nuda]|uniref:Uncharacterized protein n=1 Tax=Collybia nuda TaxID=64659 RepID=A0A9P5Y9X8_9AGAR|nr:hypothetical protein BDZ94DRAFT_1217155 [Collybia nuda]